MKIILYFIPLLTFAVEIPWYHKTHLQIEKISESLEEYRQDCGKYPTEEIGLSELVQSNKECWNGPYASSTMFTDQFSKKPYIYYLKDGGYLIVSAGQDGKFGTEDDFKSNDSLSDKKKTYSLYQHRKELKVYRKYLLFGLVILVVIILYWFRRKN